MAEKKATTKKAATEAKATAVKKTATVKKAAAPKAAKATLAVNAENIGFKAGDVYQALAAAGKALSVWLFKEGKLVNDGEKVTLA